MDLSHVNEKFRHICGLSAEKRLTFLDQPRWIGYPKADEIIDSLIQLLQMPKRPRMRSFLIVGEPNNGKTTTVLRFVDEHGAGYVDENDDPVKPVIFANSPPSAEESGLYKGILEQFFTPYNKTANASRLRYQAVDQLRKCQTKMVIFDEIHNLLNGSAKDKKTCINALRFIGNELRIPVVAVGTREAVLALHNDPQYASRYRVLELPKWELTPEFQSILVDFESILPLQKASKLHLPDKASSLHHISGGNTGDLHELLVECAKEAIKSGKEEIDASIIKGHAWFRPTRGIREQM